MNTLIDINWKLAAPSNSPAVYEFRNSQLRLSWEKADKVMQAFMTGDTSTVPHAAGMVHEAVHLSQDISTGWGYYASELFMALTIAQAGIISRIIKKTGLRESPLQENAERLCGLPLKAICENEVRTYENLSALWTSFTRGDSAVNQEPSPIDVIESHAFAYQVIELILADDREAVERSLNRSLDESNRAFNMTTMAVGAAGEADVLDFFLMLSIHKIFCELAFSVGPGAMDIQLHPVYATPDDFEKLMPESLWDRFEQIAGSAYEHLRPVTCSFFGSSNRSKEQIDRILSEVRNYKNWLKGVEILTGANLEKAWMTALLSPLLSNQNPSASEDPIRAYRSWAMKLWTPFECTEPSHRQLGHLKKLMPPVIFDTGEGQSWFMDSDRDWSIRPPNLNISQVASDLNSRLIMSLVPAFYLTEQKTETPCPYFHNCQLKQPVCETELTSGLVPGCRAEQVPVKSMGLKMHKVTGRSFNE